MQSLSTAESVARAGAGRVSDASALTHVITRLRRALRRSIRSDYPWESLPMAQVEVGWYWVWAVLRACASRSASPSEGGTSKAP